MGQDHGDRLPKEGHLCPDESSSLGSPLVQLNLPRTELKEICPKHPGHNTALFLFSVCLSGDLVVSQEAEKRVRD